MVQTIFDIPEASPAALAALPAEALMRLQQQAADHAAQAAQIVGALHGALIARYAEGLDDTGTHHRNDDEVEVTITVPKRVEYDQAALVHAIDVIRGWGEDPTHYVDTEIKVSEAKYKAWPPAIRDLFTPARTVKSGKPSFKLTPAKRRAA